MNNALAGILLGCIAGIIDIVPMIMKKLTWDANLSAFLHWAVVGFIIATSSLNMPGVAKGLLISFLVLLPALTLIARKDLKSIIPILIMTLILGSLLGFSINKLTN